VSDCLEELLLVAHGHEELHGLVTTLHTIAATAGGGASMCSMRFARQSGCLPCLRHAVFRVKCSVLMLQVQWRQGRERSHTVTSVTEVARRLRAHSDTQCSCHSKQRTKPFVPVQQLPPSQAHTLNCRQRGRAHPKFCPRGHPQHSCQHLPMPTHNATPVTAGCGGCTACLSCGVRHLRLFTHRRPALRVCTTFHNTC
jgi:hypothetical protein